MAPDIIQSIASKQLEIESVVGLQADCVQQWLFYRLIETWLKFIHNYKAFYCAHRDEGPKHIFLTWFMHQKMLNKFEPDHTIPTNILQEHCCTQYAWQLTTLSISKMFTKLYKDLWTSKNSTKANSCTVSGYSRLFCIF